jgi:hypothetical protein
MFLFSIALCTGFEMNSPTIDTAQSLLFAPAGCCYWLYFSPVSYPSACLDLLNKQIKIKKGYVLACILNFNNQFIEDMKTKFIFQKSQKNIILLYFNILDFIRCILDIK